MKNRKWILYLDGQDRYSSSLLTSLNYQKEAAKLGFDWPTIEGAIRKIRRRVGRVKS